MARKGLTDDVGEALEVIKRLVVESLQIESGEAPPREVTFGSVGAHRDDLLHIEHRFNRWFKVKIFTDDERKVLGADPAKLETNTFGQLYDQCTTTVVNSRVHADDREEILRTQPGTD